MTDEEPVGDDGRRGDHLRAAHDDAVVSLLGNPGGEERLRLGVGRLRPVDLGRHDRVGHVEVVVADTPVEGLEVPGWPCSLVANRSLAPTIATSMLATWSGVRPISPNVGPTQSVCTRRRRARSSVERGISHIVE